MKLVRYGQPGQERPGAIDPEGALRDLGELLDDFTPNFMALDVIRELREVDLAVAPLVASSPDEPGAPRIGAPLADVPNFYCIGLNYARHAKEAGAPTPAEPILFNKATSSLAGPFDPIPIPPGSERVDWEVELGVVIGREATRVSEEEALSHLAGYLLINDVSERDMQAARGGQWIKGKSAPGFGKIGPWVATADEIENPQALGLWTRVNGALVQNSNTSDMIFPVAEIVSYLSFFMTLRVGDVIATGTPEGVGLGMTPARFLEPGDVVEMGVEGLGEQRAEVVAS